VTYLGSRYRELQVINDKGEPDGNAFIVSGQVENTGDLTAQDVSVVVTTYDREGLVTGLCQVVVEDTVLAPGALSRFRVRVIPAGEEVMSYAVQAQGWRGD